jgi:hypothetical protein
LAANEKLPKDGLAGSNNGLTAAAAEEEEKLPKTAEGDLAPSAEPPNKKPPA